MKNFFSTIFILMVSVSNILAALDNGQEKLYLKHTFSSKKDFIDESDYLNFRNLIESLSNKINSLRKFQLNESTKNN